jgi:uncharacterized membrane protein
MRANVVGNTASCWTVDSLIDQGPEFVRNFVRQPHTADEFAAEFSWLLLADSVGFEAGQARRIDPALASRWADIAAVLYEGLVLGSRAEDELARDIWIRKAAHYRAVGVQLTPRVGTAPDAHDPRPV